MAIEAASTGPLRASFDPSKGSFEEVAGRLAEDLKALARSASPEGDNGQRNARCKQAVSEDIQRQLRSALQVFTEIAEDAEKADRPQAESGGSSSSKAGEKEDASELLQKMLAVDLPVLLVTSLPELDFEVRKDVISVFSSILRIGSVLGADQQLYEYAKSNPEFFTKLVDGYERSEVATKSGVMLRSCARHRRLVEAFFSFPEVVLRLLSFTRSENFDISSDAFSSLHDFLLTHKAASAVFLEANFKDFFVQYNGLLVAEDYVAQRQALKLLSEMLLHRTFMRVMLSYIGDEQYLQIHMNLLRDDSLAIQYESFHVFKIFVANPQKPPKVQQILYKNKEKLIELLQTIRPNRQEQDAQFLEDKATVIAKLEALELPAKGASQAAANPSATGTPKAAPSGGYNAT